MLLSRKGKALLLSFGIAIRIGTVVALLSLGISIQEEVGAQLDRFGANILIVPQSNSLALNYGGVPVPGVAFDVRQLKNEDVQHIREIPYHDRIAVIAPKVLSAADVNGQQVLLTGVDFTQELKLHRWWEMTGEQPTSEHDVLVGYEVARSLSLVEEGPLDRLGTRTTPATMPPHPKSWVSFNSSMLTGRPYSWSPTTWKTLRWLIACSIFGTVC